MAITCIPYGASSRMISAATCYGSTSGPTTSGLIDGIMRKRLLKALKIAGCFVGGTALLLGAHIGLLLFPGLLFSHELKHKNFALYSEAELHGQYVQILEEM